MRNTTDWWELESEHSVMPIATPEHTKEPPRNNHRNSEFPQTNDAWSDTAIVWIVDEILSYTPHYY